MNQHESPIGTLLMPIFGIATILAIVVICLMLAYPSTVTAVAALATVIGCAAALVALLGRLIGPEDH
ncbi:MAG TPA: hypothetical protein VFM58_21380 [Solirubrobacteraceae bacterium]|nr:hypothetical protein [Solirubrobacteraceae bacterium]